MFEGTPQGKACVIFARYDNNTWKLVKKIIMFLVLDLANQRIERSPKGSIVG